MAGRWLGGAIAALLALGATGLGWSHLDIRRPAPALPAVAALAGWHPPEAPVSLAWLETASQPVPRSSVLDAGRDPEPGRPYVMSFPVFVLGWTDGRRLLVDAGMDAEAAAAFARPLEWTGAGPLTFHGDLAGALGRTPGPLALVLTHLHVDHTQGAVGLCRVRPQPLPLLWGPRQAGRRNYTTRGGAGPLEEAGCLDPRLVEVEKELPEHPGVRLVAAGGHTPGSQVVLAVVRTDEGIRRFAFTGDVVNHVEGVRRGLPKPWWYRWFVVPEDDGRLAELREWLRDLEASAGFELVVSHDQQQLRSLGLPRWEPDGSVSLGASPLGASPEGG